MKESTLATAIRAKAEPRAEYDRLAEVRDERAARYLDVIAEELRLLRRVAELDAAIVDHEDADRRDRETQLALVAPGDLPFRPARALTGGVLLAGAVTALVSQAEWSLTYNAAQTRI